MKFLYYLSEGLEKYGAKASDVEYHAQKTGAYIPVSYTHLDVYKRQLPWLEVLGTNDTCLSYSGGKVVAVLVPVVFLFINQRQEFARTCHIAAFLLIQTVILNVHMHITNLELIVMTVV